MTILIVCKRVFDINYPAIMIFIYLFDKLTLNNIYKYVWKLFIFRLLIYGIFKDVF